MITINYKRLMPLLSWLLLILVLGGLGRYAWQHFEDFAVIGQLRPVWLLLLFAAYVLILWITAVRFYVVVRSLGLDISLSGWFRIFVLGRFFNRFFPQSGNVYRLVVLKNEYGFPIARYFAALGAYTYLERMVSLLLAFFIVLLVEPHLKIGGFNVGSILGMIFFLALFAVAVLTYVVKHSSENNREKSKWGERFFAISESLLDCLKNPLLFVQVVFPGIIVFFIGLALNWFLFVELGYPLSFGRIAVLQIARNFAQIISLTPGNVGVVETAYGLLGSAMNDVAATAILVAAVLNITGTLSLFLIGTAYGGFSVMRKLPQQKAVDKATKH